jgi:hypothetical protein
MDYYGLWYPICSGRLCITLPLPGERTAGDWREVMNQFAILYAERFTEA